MGKGFDDTLFDKRCRISVGGRFYYCKAYKKFRSGTTHVVYINYKGQEIFSEPLEAALKRKG